MIRKALLTLGVMALTVSGFAQTKGSCGTDDFYREQKARFPNIANQSALMEAQLRKTMRGESVNAKAKGTVSIDSTCWADDIMQFHIPVVVHVIYDYAVLSGGNPTVITDDQIYAMIAGMNQYYNKQNPDLSGIIPNWKPWIGNGHITFHLANKDPQNNPSRGIVRTYSYLTVGGDESAKINPWPPDQYLNIYLENVIGRGISNGIVLAYATFPDSYNDNPYSQGVISRTDRGYLDVATLAHEVGHFLSLKHVWDSNGQGAGGDPGKALVCGDDEVDDTPPTIGHFQVGCVANGTALYDTMCAKNYFKTYDALDYYKRTCVWTTNGGIVDYPDTTNTQNIMDYSACNSQMFTKGQVARMRATLRNSIGYRDHLVDSANLRQVGIFDANGNILPPPDITPTALFTVDHPYVCANGAATVKFTNHSYNDTIASASWTFSNGAASGTSSVTTTVPNTFTTPGWVSVSLTVTGNNTGSNTLTRNDLVYAADPTAINPIGYTQDFNSGGDINRYPIFNYYGTDHKWELFNGVGVYDHTCIKYDNYDNRNPINIANATQTPGGVYADFYTPPFDVSGFGPVCNIDFFSAGASRTAIPSKMTDTLVISASTDCGATWITQGKLAGGAIANNGLISDPFTPIYTQWKENAVPVDPLKSRSNQTMFRFRFISGTDYPTSTGFSTGTGNNFYLDRFTISGSPLGIKNGVIVNLDMNVVPNPTNGKATVSLNGGDNSTADLSVTDVTGKLVYGTSVKRVNNVTKIEIPAQAISVKGMYLVKVVTNGATETQKLVVY